MVDLYEKLNQGKQVCCTCAFYIQHYRKDGEKYYHVFCGHCVSGRLKSRKPGQTCERWQAKE